VAGVLNVATREPGVEYREEDLTTLQVFAENVGICLRHIEQTKSLRRRMARLRNDAEADSTTVGVSQIEDPDVVPTKEDVE
jgi:hypothetical protein